MSKTFSQLGIPFPLFEGPSDQASEYHGLAKCSLCGNSQVHCFQLAIGCAVMAHCAQCGAENGLDAEEQATASCRVCKADIAFPTLPDDEPLACYSCIRSGKAWMSKDSVLGMISWEQAFEGVTHGVPGLDRQDFEMVRKEGGWIGARLPQDAMFELLKTPT